MMEHHEHILQMQQDMAFPPRYCADVPTSIIQTLISSQIAISSWSRPSGIKSRGLKLHYYYAAHLIAVDKAVKGS